MIHTYIGREDQGNGWRRRAGTANGGRRHPVRQNGYHSGMRPARILLALAIGVIAPAAFVDAQKPAYPPTRKGDVVDDYFGTKVPDPVPMDGGPRLQSRSPTGWTAQNAVTFALSRSAAVARRSEEADHRALELSEGQRCRSWKAGECSTARTRGLQKQSPLYVRTALDGSPTLVIDPNSSGPTATRRSPARAPSPDAKLLAYMMSEGGADWQTIHVRESVDGQGSRPTSMKWMRFSGLSWTKDSKGFFYSRYPGAARRQGARSGAVGTGALLPSRRHAAVRGSADLRAQGPADVVRRRLRHRGRPLPARHARARAPTTRIVSTPPISATRCIRTSPRRSRRSSRATMPSTRRFGNEGSVLFLRTDLRRAEPPGHRDRSDASATRARGRPIVPERPQAIESGDASRAAASSPSISSTCRAGLMLFGLDGTACRRDQAAGHRRRSPASAAVRIRA